MPRVAEGIIAVFFNVIIIIIIMVMIMIIILIIVIVITILPLGRSGHELAVTEIR